MNRTKTLSRGLLLAAALVAGLLAAFYAVNASGAGTTRVVMTAKNKALGRTILVNLRGLSLYSLSVERHGKFICTNMACLALWHPLTVPKGTKPTGVARLGTVKRPGGKLQVTYRGAPLYTFAQDTKKGDVKGNGFKDVGVWKVVARSKSASHAAPPPPPRYGY